MRVGESPTVVGELVEVWSGYFGPWIIAAEVSESKIIGIQDEDVGAMVACVVCLQVSKE